MIGQIGHLGQASPKSGIGAAALWATGMTIGAASVGLVAGSAGWMLQWISGHSWSVADRPVLLVLAFCTTIAALRDFGLYRPGGPRCRRQVTRAWFTVHGPCRAALFWGLLMGFGRTTRMPFATYYVVLLWAILMASPAAGAALLALYGAVAGALLLVEVAAMSRNGARSRGLLGLDRTRWLYPLGGYALLGAAAVLIGHLL